MISVTVSVPLSYPPSSIVTFPTENTCISLTSEALDPLPNAAYHEVIETLASLFPAASCTAGTGIQCSWVLLVFYPNSCIFLEASSLLLRNLMQNFCFWTKLFLWIVTFELFKIFILKFSIKRGKDTTSTELSTHLQII